MQTQKQLSGAKQQLHLLKDRVLYQAWAQSANSMTCWGCCPRALEYYSLHEFTSLFIPSFILRHNGGPTDPCILSRERRMEHSTNPCTDTVKKKTVDLHNMRKAEAESITSHLKSTCPTLGCQFRQPSTVVTRQKDGAHLRLPQGLRQSISVPVEKSAAANLWAIFRSHMRCQNSFAASCGLALLDESRSYACSRSHNMQKICRKLDRYNNNSIIN